MQIIGSNEALPYILAKIYMISAYIQYKSVVKWTIAIITINVHVQVATFPRYIISKTIHYDSYKWAIMFS